MLVEFSSSGGRGLHALAFGGTRPHNGLRSIAGSENTMARAQVHLSSSLIRIVPENSQSGWASFEGQDQTGWRLSTAEPKRVQNAGRRLWRLCRRRLRDGSRKVNVRRMGNVEEARRGPAIDRLRAAYAPGATQSCFCRGLSNRYCARNPWRADLLRARAQSKV